MRTGAERPVPVVETIEGPPGSSVSISPERGGIITSLKLGGTELLYMEEDTFQDTSKNVRGGIPILFPNAGPVEDARYPGLKQHGFARNSAAWQHRSASPDTPSAFSESLAAGEASRAVFPHDFELIMRGRFSSARSFILDQTVLNRDRADMPLAMGLHPYFRVPSSERSAIRFDFPGGEELEVRQEEWMNGQAVSIENPGSPLRVEVPNGGNLELKVSPEYKRIWVWSMPDKDFVCIEPVMRDAGGLVTDPEILGGHETITGRFEITLRD